MYIQEIIIDGFKSYATRTVINGWDPSFNAITGTFAGRCRVRRCRDSVQIFECAVEAAAGHVVDTLRIVNCVSTL